MQATDGEVAGAGGGQVVAAELPLHLTEKILCSISPLESARHAAVCKSWAATVAARLARPVPHLFLCAPPSAIGSDRRGLVVSVPLDDDDGAAPATIPARVRSSDTNGLRCIGATPGGGGRVAFAAGWWSSDVVLVNPVTGALQRVNNVGEPRLDPRFSRVVAADDSFFAVEGYKLVLWRREKAHDAAHRDDGGEEEEATWSSCAVSGTLNPTNNIVSAVLVDSNGGGCCFYLLHEDGRLSIVDATVPPPLRMEKLPVEALADQFGSGRLVESDGEVLFVRQLLAYKEGGIAIASCTSSSLLSVAGFEVYRLDVKEQQRWTKVDKLAGDRALFVSPGSSFAVRASEVEGCRSNCIYFAGENQYYSSPACREDGDTSWGVYSMEDRRVLFEHVVVTEAGRMRAEVLWFLPRVTLKSSLICKSFHN